jgi:hypothetical protein
MRQVRVWAALAGVGLMAYAAARVREALLKVDLTGSITSSAATTVAICLLWHGLETMTQQDRGNPKLGRWVRAPTEPALPGGPPRAGTPHPSLPHKGGGVPIPPPLWGRTVDWIGSISRLAATTVANCLLWHGLETMPQLGLETMPQLRLETMPQPGLETMPQLGLETMPQHGHGLEIMPQRGLATMRQHGAAHRLSEESSVGA